MRFFISVYAYVHNAHMAYALPQSQNNCPTNKMKGVLISHVHGEDSPKCDKGPPSASMMHIILPVW